MWQMEFDCNCISPGRVHTPFVEWIYWPKTYPGQEKEMFENLAATQQLENGSAEEIAELALFLSSDAGGLSTGPAN